MASAPKRRRPRPASRPAFVQTYLRWRYLALYGAHAPFCEELLVFADRVAGEPAVAPLVAQYGNLFDFTMQMKRRGPAAADAGTSYLTDLHALAAQWGLDRLGAHAGRPSDGEQVLHRWCSVRVGGANLPPSEIMTCLAVADRLPDVDSGISFQGTWQLMHESLSEARRRLLADFTRQLDARLERIATDAEAAGYVYADTAPKQGLPARPQRTARAASECAATPSTPAPYLYWLWEHVALGRTWAAIADETEAEPGGYVVWNVLYNRAAEVAKRVGVALSTV